MHRILKKLLMELSYSSNRYLLAPEFVSLSVTFKCNFHCQTCSIWKIKNFQELSDKEWLKITRKLRFLPPETFIEISGGEPLIRKKLVLKLIKNLKKHFKNVALNSNGYFINENTINELEQTNLDIIKISLYSLSKKTHNFLKGKAKAYNHAIKAIKKLAKSKIKTEIGILITAKNIKEIPKLIRYFGQFKNISLILQPLGEDLGFKKTRNREKNNPIALWPKASEVKNFFRWLKNNNNEKIKNHPAHIEAIKSYYLNPKGTLKYRCFAGQRSLIVQPNGEVLLCFNGQVIGNLINKDLKTILKSNQAIEERKAIKKCQKYCRVIGCNFSRGIFEILKYKLKTIFWV